MIPSIRNQLDPCTERTLKKRAIFKMPSTRKSDASTKVSDATPTAGLSIRYPPKNTYASPTSSLQIRLPASRVRKATIRWTTHAKKMSQAITTLTATAAMNGDPTARTPKMMSETPHRMDTVEAERTTPDGVC